MADVVKAADNIAFKNPLRRGAFGERQVQRLHSVCAAALPPEPKRVRVGERFRDRIKRQQVKRLHGPVLHRRDSQRARFAV